MAVVMRVVERSEMMTVGLVFVMGTRVGVRKRWVIIVEKSDGEMVVVERCGGRRESKGTVESWW